MPALGKELFQVLDPLILRHDGCLPLSLSKYEEGRPRVTLCLGWLAHTLPMSAALLAAGREH